MVCRPRDGHFSRGKYLAWASIQAVGIAKKKMTDNKNASFPARLRLCPMHRVSTEQANWMLLFCSHALVEK
jgi:hypothetical protein